MAHASVIELYVEFEQIPYVIGAVEEVQPLMEFEDYYSDSEEEFEGNYEISQPNEEDSIEHEAELDVKDVANALANKLPFQESSFMRVLDIDALNAQEFDMNLECSGSFNCHWEYPFYFRSGKKQLQDGNRTTVGGSSAQTPLGRGSHGRGPRPRVEQPTSHHQTAAGWYPFGMPLNFQPSGVQFGSMSNEPLFNGISRNAASSSTIPPLSTAAVRQLIEESHLDLVNLLTSHLTTLLNPIVADSNAKYDQLPKRFNNLIEMGDDEGHNLNQVQNGMGHE
ncbi:hypothetical protein PIB30_086058 [Stylosanthes scabra]|uniref:Uncharacterized protein n=1 Tax=Stylosanthes scabra TaxID=79078 RepID=A0ABU6TSH7_9FABA|nr:hypothetical protein [Stylosanthes scabra]